MDEACFEIPSPPDQRPDYPIPFGVDALTGALHEVYEAPDADDVKTDLKQVRDREEKTLALMPGYDANKLSDAGWGVVFARDIDPAVKEALKPLLQHRKAQVGDDRLFRIFEGAHSPAPEVGAPHWLLQQGVALAPVDPENGVPYYLLLVGNPLQIPFEFQYTLDSQWCVGRLDLNSPQDYACYAERLVAYEQAASPALGNDLAMWMPANGDTATTMLCHDVGLPLHRLPLGEREKFLLHTYLGKTATKSNLAGLLDGSLLGRKPAVLFTGSHGLEWPLCEPERQAALQGALVTQEWRPGQKVDQDSYFAGEDITSGLDLQGMVHFLFACFGAGYPRTDNYPKPGVEPRQIATAPEFADLPKRMLARGALGVIGHIDRAWNWSFQGGGGQPQHQLMRSVLKAMMLGMRLGLAMDYLNIQWGALAGQLGILVGPQMVFAPAGPALSNLVVARDDARNYVLLGDPAAQLRPHPEIPTP